MTGYSCWIGLDHSGGLALELTPTKAFLSKKKDIVFLGEESVFPSSCYFDEARKGSYI